MRSEWIVRISGNVRHPPNGTDSPKIPTGQVEAMAKTLYPDSVLLRPQHTPSWQPWFLLKPPEPPCAHDMGHRPVWERGELVLLKNPNGPRF